MLVYGDASRHELAADKLGRIAAALDRAAASRTGLARHGALVDALLEAGELAQALADREFRLAGNVDGASSAADAALGLTMAIARRVAVSWTSAFTEAALPLADEIDRCTELAPRDAIEVKQPEGYAFYALYPESYLVAARALAPRRWQAIGVRSIGTSLACIVAVGLGADAPITVRPFGDPFDRTVAVDAARIDRGADAFAIVDEGPGLSGSSVAAVARWLIASGVDEDCIHVFAGHRDGPGAHAGTDARTFWQRAATDGRIHATSFDALVLHAAVPAHRLDGWVGAIVGPLAAPLREIGGGAWRELRARRPAAPLPPAHPWQERRKFLAVGADGRRWLVKFNGLGRRGEAKLARARALAADGFVPQPVATCHGFLVEHWLDGSELQLPLSPQLRSALVDRIAAYLVRRGDFVAPADGGASLAVLATMARQNTEEAVGRETAAAWDRWTPVLPALAEAVRRIETDNRMHAWEWLVSGAAIVKCDAIDHHVGHDPVGCQDVAWDIAGAAVEIDLDDDEVRTIAGRVGAARGSPVPGELLAFCRAAYLAFQLGVDDEAMRAARDPEEAGRWRDSRDRRATLLRGALAPWDLTPRR